MKLGLSRDNDSRGIAINIHFGGSFDVSATPDGSGRQAIRMISKLFFSSCFKGPEDRLLPSRGRVNASNGEINKDDATAVANLPIWMAELPGSSVIAPRTNPRRSPRTAPAQPELFATPLVPGFACAEAIVGADEERDLLGRVRDAGLSPFRFQQWTGKRLTRSFGWRYDFETGGFGQTDPIPDWLDPLRARAARFAGLAPGELVQALLTRYDPGAGIGWHRDRPVFEHVIGVSLGHPATLRLRRRTRDGFERASRRKHSRRRVAPGRRGAGARECRLQSRPARRRLQSHVVGAP